MEEFGRRRGDRGDRGDDRREKLSDERRDGNRKRDSRGGARGSAWESEEGMRGGEGRPRGRMGAGAMGGGGGQQFGGPIGLGPSQLKMDSAFGGPNRKYEKKIMDMMGSTVNLPDLETPDKKFSASNKVFVGSLPVGCNEDSLRELCKPYGEVNDVFVQREKRFGFAKFDYKVNAERFKYKEDGKATGDRNLKIRFSSSHNTIKVKNLNACVTNELLHKAFSIFGTVEKVKVIPKPYSKMNEGIVEFNRQQSVQEAIQVCNEFPFVLTTSLIPLSVESVEDFELEDEGMPEKNMARDDQYFHERDIGPRFIKPGTFDFNFCEKFLQLNRLRREKQMALEKEMELEEEKLITQMEVARYDYETEMYKEMFQRREQERMFRMEMLNQRQRDVDRRLEMHQEQRRMNESNFDFSLAGPSQGPSLEYEDMRGGGGLARDDGGDQPINPMMGGHGRMDGPKPLMDGLMDMPGMMGGNHEGMMNDSLNMNLLNMMQQQQQMNNPDPEMWKEFDNGSGKRPRFPNEVMRAKKQSFGRGGKRS